MHGRHGLDFYSMIRKRPPVRTAGTGSKENSCAVRAGQSPVRPQKPGGTATKPIRGGNYRPSAPSWTTSSPEDDGGTGGAGGTESSRSTGPTGPVSRARVVRGGSRSPNVRQPSPRPINQEARDWLEENANRLAMQTHKCLQIHRQLQDLLSQQGSPMARTDGPGSSKESTADQEVPWQSKALSLRALEGSPMDLLEHVSATATSERRDQLKSDLKLAEDDLARVREELRADQWANDQFDQALEVGTQAEIHRLQEEVSVLEVRIHERLHTLKQLATQAMSPRWPAASPSSHRVLIHSPIPCYNFGKARSTSPPRQRATVPLTMAQPTQCGGCRAVSVPMIAAKQAKPPTLIRVAAAAAAATGREAAAALPLQQLDDVRHRVQAEFWSGTM